MIPKNAKCINCIYGSEPSKAGWMYCSYRDAMWRPNHVCVYWSTKTKQS